MEDESKRVNLDEEVKVEEVKAEVVAEVKEEKKPEKKIYDLVSFFTDLTIGTDKLNLKCSTLVHLILIRDQWTSLL